MENPDKKYVYHGSSRKFDSDHAIPKSNIRENAEGKVIFDQESFHATPHKWVALAYTYHAAPYQIDGRTARYGMGVDLYQDTKTIGIFGFGSLEESLQKMYGDGGYVYHFGKDGFIYKEGLGNLEVIATEPTEPVTVERIDNPVEEMRKLGVSFEFIDLGSPENEAKRNYTD